MSGRARARSCRALLASWMALAACGGAGTMTEGSRAAHAAMTIEEPRPQPFTLELPSVTRATLSSGTTVFVVTRPDALVGHVAILGARGALVEQARVARDRVIASLLADLCDARVTLGRDGLRISRGASIGETVELAAVLLSFDDDPRLRASDVFRASATVSDQQATGMSVVDDSRARRLFGQSTLEWELASTSLRIPQPSVEEVRARLGELLDPARTTLVLVVREDASEVTARLERLLAGPARDAEPSLPARLDPPTPLAPSPQLHGFAQPFPVALVRASAVGPSPYETDAAYFALGVRLLAGSHASPLFRTLRMEGDNYVVQARLAPRVGQTMATIELSVRPDGTAQAVALLLAELERLGDPARIGLEELEIARRLELAQELARLERAEELADAILDADVASTSLEAHARRFDALAHATAADVARVVGERLTTRAVALDVLAPAEALAQISPVPGGQAISREL